jgi:hypothetical protein
MLVSETLPASPGFVIPATLKVLTEATETGFAEVSSTFVETLTGWAAVCGAFHCGV